MIVSLPLKAVEALADSGLINYLSPDRQMKTTGHLENSTGAAAVRNQTPTGSKTAYTLDGTNVGIAILDSGMLPTHKDFVNNSNVSRIAFSKSFVPTETDVDDNYGHGTHVAGIAAGNSNNTSGAYKGVAPNASLINLKVLNKYGVGSTSYLLAALDWIKLNYSTYKIRVVNLQSRRFGD